MEQKGLKCCAIFLVMIFAAVLGSGVNIIEKQKSAIMNTLLDKHDSSIVPRNTTNNEDKPVKIEVNTYIRSLDVDTQNMESKVSLTFRAMWVDKRLEYNDFDGKIKYLNFGNDQRLWKPDLFFSNEKEAKLHTLTTPNVLMRVYPNGTVLYSQRLSLKLACPMDFTHFPADNQVCSIIIASYAHTTDDMYILWRNGDPIQVTKHLFMRHFTLTKVYTDYCTSKTATGTYSCLKIDLLVKRDQSYVLGRIYYPIILLVVVSYLCFWLNSVEHATPKILVSAACLLFAMGFSSWQYGNLVGDITYSTYLCCWLTWCHALMLLAAVESVLVCWLTTGQKSIGDLDMASKNKFQKALRKFSPTAHPIDMVFRLFYPIIFLLYNVVYWTNLSSLAESE